MALCVPDNENFEAHPADFSSAKLICAYETHVTTNVVGTLGYIPHKYGQSPVATYKGDVYSFGFVLLELLTGRRPVDMYMPKGAFVGSFSKDFVVCLLTSFAHMV